MKPYPTCTFVLTRGTLCESPALKGEKFCYFHHREHQRKLNFQEARELKSSDQFYRNPIQQEALNPEIMESLDIPSLDDGASIQVAVSNIVRAVLSGHVSEKRAGLALYGCQIAAGNLEKARIGISKFEAENAAATDPAPIAPLLDSAPKPAGYLEELAAARKLIDSAKKLGSTRSAVRSADASTSSTAIAANRSIFERLTGMSKQSPPSSTPQTNNDKAKTVPACHSDCETAEAEGPASPETRELKLETASRETANSKPETGSRGTRNVQRETSDVRVWRNPGPNSKTFAQHVRLAEALHKGTIDAGLFRKEQKEELKAQRNGDSSSP